MIVETRSAQETYQLGVDIGKKQKQDKFIR